MNFKDWFDNTKLREFFDRNFKYIIICVVIVGVVLVGLISWLVVGLFTDNTTKVTDEYVGAFNDATDNSNNNKGGFVNAGVETDLEGRSYGIDVSKWQGVIDWKSVKDFGTSRSLRYVSKNIRL